MAVLEFKNEQGKFVDLPIPGSGGEIVIGDIEPKDNNVKIFIDTSINPPSSEFGNKEILDKIGEDSQNGAMLFDGKEVILGDRFILVEKTFTIDANGNTQLGYSANDYMVLDIRANGNTNIVLTTYTHNNQYYVRATQTKNTNQAATNITFTCKFLLFKIK